jgi:uncharacterized protein (DUF4415 family)
MRESKGALGSDLAKVDETTDEDIARQITEDPDTAPELTDEWFDKAELRVGDKVLRRGRSPLTSPKQLVSLRLDQDVIDRFRADGPGWQSRMNAALRKHLGESEERARDAVEVIREEDDL